MGPYGNENIRTPSAVMILFFFNQTISECTMWQSLKNCLTFYGHLLLPSQWWMRMSCFLNMLDWRQCFYAIWGHVTSSSRPRCKLLRFAKIYNISCELLRAEGLSMEIHYYNDELANYLRVINDLLAITYQCCCDLEWSQCNLVQTPAICCVCEDCLRVRINDWETISVRVYCNHIATPVTGKRPWCVLLEIFLSDVGTSWCRGNRLPVLSPSWNNVE